MILIEGFAKTAIVLVDNMQARIQFGVLIQNFASGIYGAIIYGNDLYIC